MRPLRLECSETELIQGTLFSGRGEGAHFIKIPWVQREIRNLLGFLPFPGTLNVRLSNPASKARWKERLALGGLPLREECPSELTCGGTLFSVIIEKTTEGAVVVPDTTHYDQNVLEIVAPMSLRDHFRLKDGDRVTLHFKHARSAVPHRHAETDRR